MADNKTKLTKVSATAFIDALPDEGKRTDAKVLVRLMQGATGEQPTMWGPSIIGFRTYHYTYESGREGNMPLTGFSPRRPALVLYAIEFAGSEELLTRLGKHTTGKSCLYIKKLADINQEVLKALVVKSVAAVRERYAL